MKTPKISTANGKWIVDEGYKISEFDTAKEMWYYILLLRELRPKAPWVPQSLYPVKHLTPFQKVVA
jgi:hypothetical protein